MNVERVRRFARGCIGTAAFACCVVVAAARAEDARQQPAWQPKNGPYAAPDGDFRERCLDFGDLTLDLARRSIGGGGDGECDILKSTSPQPGVLKLEMSCIDDSGERPHQESAVIERVDDDLIFYRETRNGKFDRPRTQMRFCGETIQKMYEDAQKKQLG
jgi:hypothetical protein